MNIEEQAVRQLAEEAGAPDRWREMLGTNACAFRALELAVEQFLVDLQEAFRPYNIFRGP